MRRSWPRLLWVLGLVVAAVALRTALPELRESINALDRAHTGLLAVAVCVEIAALATLPLTFRAALTILGGGVRYGAALDSTLGALRPEPGGAGWRSRRWSLRGAPVHARR